MIFISLFYHSDNRMIDNSSISTFLKENGMTGNPMIDTMIITSMIPLIISYVSWISGIGLKLLSVVGQYFVGSISTKLKEKFSGKQLLIVEVKKDENMFQFFKDHIFEKKVASDQIAKSFFEGIGNLLKKEYDYKKANKEWKKKRQNRIKIDFDYSDQTDSKFAYRAASNYCGEKEIKYFKYKKYVVSISLKKINDGELIKIKLYNTINEDISKAESVKTLEQFFSDRFDLQQFIKYTFSLKMGSVHTRSFRVMIQNTLISANTGRLNVGDDSHDSQNVFTKNNSFSLKLLCNAIKTKDSFMEDLELNPAMTSEDAGESIGIKFYCNKYIGKNSFSKNRSDKYGYFWYNKDLYILFADPANIRIFIISPETLLESDIKGRMDWLLKVVAEKQNKNLTQVAKKKTVVYKYYVDRDNNYQWSGTNIDPRNFDTMYLPSKLKKNILAEINTFFSKEKLYRKYQIPYKKGILFYGPPGTGKTTLVKTIAHEYQINIFTININDETVNDDSIMQIINSISGDNIKILLFEDIDSAFADKEKLLTASKVTPVETTSKESGKNVKTLMTPSTTNQKFLTYSGLLNALDGVMSSQSGIITIMTTNYLDKLGEALIRPGRIDSKFELKECNSEQIFDMVRSCVDKFAELQTAEIKDFEPRDYIPDNYEAKTEQFVEKLMDGQEYAKIKPCALQFYILKHIENVDDIFENVNELLMAI